MVIPPHSPSLDPSWGPLFSVWLSGSKGAGSFPGSNILALVAHVSLHLRSSVDALLEGNRWVGERWAGEWTDGQTGTWAPYGLLLHRENET